MSLTDAMVRWLSDDENVIYECRECGTTLESGELRCPHCGSLAIAEYDIS